QPQSLFRDSRNRIWVSTPRGIGRLDDDRLMRIAGASNDFVNAITEDAQGNLWLARQNSALVRLSPDGQVRQISWSTLGHGDPVTRMIADRSRDGLWLGLYGSGLAHYANDRVEATYSAADGLGKGRVADLRLEPDGTLWIATEGGLSRLKGGRIATLSTKNGLPCDAVHWMIEDEIDSIWLRMNCGLVRIPRSEVAAWE